MVVLLGSLLGFLSSALPSILSLFKDNNDKKHELAVMDKQIELAKIKIDSNLEAVEMQADAAKITALYNSITPINKESSWVDKLNGSVRPIIAYCLFGSYVFSRVANFYIYYQSGQSIDLVITTIWDNEDMALLASVFTFYFGAKQFEKK